MQKFIKLVLVLAKSINEEYSQQNHAQCCIGFIFQCRNCWMVVLFMSFFWKTASGTKVIVSRVFISKIKIIIYIHT